MRLKQTASRGFTLIEMLVVAPIVILSIGAFIALIVNLTGEVMSSRGSNSLAFDIQDTVNRIEQDVKLSTGFLAYNTVGFDTTNQAQSADNGATTALFKNTGNSEGPMLILNGLVTTGNPTSLTSSNVYLINQPNDCSNPVLYAKNRPMTLNIVYFVKDGALWRRTIMPSNYSDSAARCGDAPWQQPSCTPGYSSSFCATNDVKLIDNYSSLTFSLYYYANASNNTPISGVNLPTTPDATRAASLQTATTVTVALSVEKSVAGRTLSREASLRATRVETNATSVVVPSVPASAPAIPVVTGVVSDGHRVTYSWPQVATATSYDLQYRINGGAWQTPSGSQNISNSVRSYTVLEANHDDTVEAQVKAKNICSTGACESSWSASTSISIPIWAPLILQNGWIKYPPPYPTPAYTKTASGVVMLKGLLKGGSYNAITASLPEEYRPSANLMFETSTNPGAACRVDVFPTGTISITSVCSNVWAGLDGINFMAADASFTGLTLQNSWVNFGSGWSNAGYMVDSLGRVHTQGLIKSGITTSGTVITALPGSLVPSGYSHVANINSDANSHFSMNTSGQIVAKIGSNAYLALQSMYYPSANRAVGSDCTTQWCALTLQNGWVHFGSPYTTPAYTKSADGIVMIKGLIKSGTATSGITLSTLPAGFCPKERLLLTGQAADAWARIDIVPNVPASAGCIVMGANVSATWTSLDSVIFRAEQ